MRNSNYGVTVESLKRAKLKLIEIFESVWNEDIEIISIHTVHMIGERIAEWSYLRSDEELASMMRVANSSLAEEDVDFVFDSVLQEGFSTVEVDRFNRAESRFLPEEDLLIRRYPLDESNIRLICRCNKSGEPESLYNGDMEDEDIEVEMSIRFLVDYNILTGELYIWLGMYGDQVTHREEDHREEIGIYHNRFFEWFSEWEHGVEGPIRKRSVFHDIFGDDTFEY